MPVQGEIISGLFNDQQEVSADDFYEISGVKVQPNDVKDLYAYWTPDVIPSCTIGITNVARDMEEYYDYSLYGNKTLKDYEYDETTQKGGQEVKPRTNPLTSDIILPDLSMSKDGKNEIHDGFIGWQYYDYKDEKIKIARTVTIDKDEVNGTKINGQKMIYTALWADHYAASIWGIDHDYNIYGVTNTSYGKPNYNKSDVQMDAGSSNHINVTIKMYKKRKIKMYNTS